LPGITHQQLVDTFLMQGMVGALLAHVNALRIAPAHVEYRVGDEMVIDHHVGLLHEPQRPEGQ